MNDLRAAVVGAGRFGALHSKKYAALQGVDLRYVVDIDPERARQVADSAGAEPLDDYCDLVGKIDLVSVAPRGVTHRAIAGTLMESAIDVLLEKPMATTLEQANELAEV